MMQKEEEKEASIHMCLWDCVFVLYVCVRMGYVCV